MAESLINTKRRINTIRSTEKITKARKLVASVKYQRWKKRYTSNLGYEKARQEIRYTAFGCLNEKDKLPDAMVSHKEAKKKLYIIRTSTLGLCGAYNYNVFKRIDKELTEDDELLLIGSKGISHYTNKNYERKEDYSNLRNHFTFGQVKHLRHEIVNLYRTGKYKEVHLVYTHYKNSLNFIPQDEIILPFKADKEEVEKRKEAYPPLIEPDKREVISTTVLHYLDARIYQKLIESEISELCSRRNAMETATDSAEQIRGELRIQYNKSRQNAITQEITEVVAGANVGKKKED